MRKVVLARSFTMFLARPAKTSKPGLGVETFFKFVAEAEGSEISKVEDMDDVHGNLVPVSEYDADSDDGWTVKLVNLIQVRGP